MNILIATHDFEARKAHLMPWRIVDEVAKELRKRACDVRIVSLAQEDSGAARGEPPPGVVVISKNRKKLAGQLTAFIEKNAIDVIFWPLTWREPKWRIEVIGRLPVARIGYIPSGVFSVRTGIYALCHLGWRTALPYVIDSLVPNRRLVRLANLAGFTDMITFSEFTAKVLGTAGWSTGHAHYIPPGKESKSGDSRGELTASITQWLNDEPFFLFMGPPSGIRGIYELLTAFERAAARNTAFRLICLFRPDDELDSARIRRIIHNSRYRQRIHAEWEMIDRETLGAYMARAKAIVMPFVLVPSEIPLAIIETLGFGKPIITTSPGGTGDFVNRFGFAPRVGDKAALADAMLTLVENSDVYREKCQAAALAHEQLADWSGMADKWLRVVQSARSTSETT